MCIHILPGKLTKGELTLVPFKSVLHNIDKNSLKAVFSAYAVIANHTLKNEIDDVVALQINRDASCRLEGAEGSSRVVAASSVSLGNFADVFNIAQCFVVLDIRYQYLPCTNTEKYHKKIRGSIFNTIPRFDQI